MRPAPVAAPFSTGISTIDAAVSSQLVSSPNTYIWFAAIIFLAMR
jgi:hypothetical protein